MKRPILSAVALLFYLFPSAQVSSSPATGWDMNKGSQPVITRLSSAMKGVPGVPLQVFNNYLSRPLSNLELNWELLSNGVVVQRGKVPTPLVIGPQQSRVVRLPVRVPAHPGEVILYVFYKLRKTMDSMPAGTVVAEAQLPIVSYTPDLSVQPAGELSFTDEGGVFSIHSVPGLDMQFNKQTGWLERYIMAGHSLLADTGGLSAELWPGVDPRLQLFSTSTSTDIVVVKADYLLQDPGEFLHVRYTVNAKGEMQVEQSLEQDSTGIIDTTSGAPPLLMGLPRFGMQWSLATGLDSVTFYGKSPLDSSLRRPAAAFVSIHHQLLKDTLPGMSIRWWKVKDPRGSELQVMADSSLLNIYLRQGKLRIEQPTIPARSYHYIYKVAPL